MFDHDCDGALDRSEVTIMAKCMVDIRNQTLAEADKVNPNMNMLINEILSDGKDNLSIEDYLVWAAEHKELPAEFAKLIYQLCHIVLGLRPPSRQAEGEIVQGWLDREENAPMSPGQIWYLLNMDWWSQWHAYVNFVNPNDGLVVVTTTPTFRKVGKPQLSVDSTDSSGASGGGVVGTNYNQLNSMLENHSLRPPSSATTSGGEGSNRSSQAGTPITSPHISRKNSTHLPSKPGLIDNSSLIQPNPYKVSSLTGEGGKLKPSLKLVRGKDFELIPDRLWRALIQWYGGSPALPRQVIRNNRGHVELELHPLNIKLLKHQTVPRQVNHVPTVVGGYSAAAIHASGGSYGSLSSTPPTTTRRYHAYQAAFSRRTTIGQIEEFLCQRMNTKSEDLRLWHFRDEAHMKLLVEPQAVLEEAGFRDEDSLLVEVRSRDGTWPEEISSLVTSNDRRSSSATLNSAVQHVPGITGLNNLGNTCYMNAAVQCVSNTKILAQYFQRNCHLHELNRANPLGTNGHVAKRFGDLVRDMWAASNAKTIAPIKLRWTISRYSQNFSGFQQQDSQELLAFLLDGLHEDLNRVMIKPYDELKDSDGRPDNVVAQEAWQNHERRNQSVIVDLFHGQLKSKVTCKVCGHESVKFDPFTYLSLPLPMESSVHIEAIVIRQDGSVPVKYGLTMDMEAKYSDIKPCLSKLCKIPAGSLILVDIVQSQFRVTSNVEQKLKGLNGSCIFAYEFPSLSPQTALISVSSSSSCSQKAVVPQSLSDIQRGTVARKSFLFQFLNPVIHNVCSKNSISRLW
jgi:ubiquitin carboxyl-terminal hydrolase 6/32